MKQLRHWKLAILFARLEHQTLPGELKCQSAGSSQVETQEFRALTYSRRQIRHFREKNVKGSHQATSAVFSDLLINTLQVRRKQNSFWRGKGPTRSPSDFTLLFQWKAATLQNGLLVKIIEKYSKPESCCALPIPPPAPTLSPALLHWLQEPQQLHPALFSLKRDQWLLTSNGSLATCAWTWRYKSTL